MNKLAWKALLNSTPLHDILSGRTLHFGEHLGVLSKELDRYNWPREDAPLTLAEVKKACSAQDGFGISSDSYYSTTPPPDLHKQDVLLVWQVIHTQDLGERSQILQWLLILCAARYAARELFSTHATVNCLLRNVSKFYSTSTIFAFEILDCRCGRDGQQKAEKSAHPSPSTESGECIEAKSLKVAKTQGPKARHSVCTVELDHSTQLLTTDTPLKGSQHSKEDGGTEEQIESKKHQNSCRLQVPYDSENHVLTGHALLVAIRNQLSSVNIQFCDELFWTVQNLYGWSAQILVRYYSMCAQWHYRMSGRLTIVNNTLSGSSPHQRVRAMTDESCQIANAEDGAQRILRRDVLAITYGVLRCSVNVINDLLCRPANLRVDAAFNARSTIQTSLDVLQKSKNGKNGAMTSSQGNQSCKLENLWRVEMVRRLQDVVHSAGCGNFISALCYELRSALLCVCGSANDLHCLAWVDVMTINMLESLGLPLGLDMDWLRQRWLALPNILKLYDHRFAIHNAVSIASAVNKVFRLYAPPGSVEPPIWLERVLLRIYENGKLFQMNEPLIHKTDETVLERLNGLAALTCEFSDVQKSKSNYWVHIHPLIGHLIDPNYSDQQKIVSIPFEVHENHFPVFREIMFQLMLKSNSGSSEFCSAYVESILYSVFKESSGGWFERDFVARENLLKARVHWRYLRFEEFILFHEKCIPTKFMIDGRPSYYAEEFMRYSGEEFVKLEFTKALPIIRALSKSQKFVDELAKRKAIIIELV